jgi:hypothetical protein
MHGVAVQVRPELGFRFPPFCLQVSDIGAAYDVSSIALLPLLIQTKEGPLASPLFVVSLSLLIHQFKTAIRKEIP